MTQEALLAFLHLSAILAMVVFLTSEAALCRPQWFNAAVIERLVRVDRIYGIAALSVLATGLARIYFGVKGAAWYWSNWLLHIKLGLFIAVALLSIYPTLQFIRWRRDLRATGDLPSEAAIKRVRRLVMIQGHIIPVIPLAAVFLARGWGG